MMGRAGESERHGERRRGVQDAGMRDSSKRRIGVDY